MSRTRTTPQLLRQGDVLLRRVRALPAKVAPVPRDAGRVVLAYGEVTGHAHAILEPDVELFETVDDALRFLVVDHVSAALTHEEHDTLTLAPGVYQVVRQREYSPEAIRNVAD